MGKLTRVEHVRSGPLFDVSRALLDGRPVFMKTVGERDAAARSKGFASLYADHPSPTAVFVSQGMGWSGGEEASPERVHYESLLRAELDVIRAVQDYWNHPGAWLGQRCGDELVDAGGEICLMMPACEGTPLARLTRREQREWIPAMLPALWRALSYCPHGDLDPDDLLIDPSGRFFRILDPGVRVAGPSDGGTTEPYFGSELFTTNAAQYPLLLPEHGPDRPVLCAPFDGLLARRLKAHEERYYHHMMLDVKIRDPGDASPAAADLIAIGAIYAFALTGVPLSRLLGLDRPLWSGGWGGRGLRDVEQEHRCLEEIEGGALLRTLRNAGATEKEAELCVRLVALRVDSPEDLAL